MGDFIINMMTINVFTLNINRCILYIRKEVDSLENVKIKLDHLMWEKRKSIQDLHKETKLSRTVISEILHGKREKIRLDTIAKLCQALQCQIGDLIKIDREGA